MPSSTNNKELATFLGMLNFLPKYIANFSSKNKELCGLQKQKKFIWGEKQKEALREL